MINKDKKRSASLVAKKKDSADNISRRDFFKLAATSGVAAAVVSCNNDPVESLVPLLNPPQGIEAGQVYKFASTCQQCSAGCGIHVNVVDGRAIGIEGNPDHPLNKGGLCAIGQSGLQELYSPSRVKSPLENGVGSNWSSILDKVSTIITNTPQKILFIGNSRRTHLNKLIDNFCSEINADQLKLDSNPYQSLKQANLLLFNQEEIPFYDFANAKTIVSFGADFLESWHSVMENTMNYTAAHTAEGADRAYHVHFSPNLSLTAAKADQWISCPIQKEYKIVLGLMKIILDQQKTALSQDIKDLIDQQLTDFSLSELSDLGIDVAKLQNLAAKMGTDGTALCVAGGLSVSSERSLELYLAVNLLNYICGSINKTVRFGADYQFAGESQQVVSKVLAALENGAYGTVFIHDLNLLRSLPQEKRIKSILLGVPNLIGFYSVANETSSLCQIVLPIATSYESFDVVNAKAGINSLQQPAMGKIAGIDWQAMGDIILQLAVKLNITNSNFAFPDFQAWLKNSWIQQFHKPEDGAIDNFWNRSLQYGGLFTETPFKSVSLESDKLQDLKLNPATGEAKQINLATFNSNLANVNANYGNRGWLAEVPHPITQITWDSWAEMHPDLAAEYGIEHGDEVKLTTAYGSVLLAAYVYHGVHPSVVAVPAGMGNAMEFPNYSSRRNIVLPFTSDDPQTLTSKVVGVNVLDLLPADTSTSDLNLTTKVSIEKTGAKANIASADGQWRDSIYSLQADTPAQYGERGQKERGLLQYVKQSDIGSGHSGAHHGSRDYEVKEGTTFDFYNDISEQVKQENIKYGFEVNNPPAYHDPYRFEMVIDLDKCTGCSSCVVACYAENNIPVVGKERVALNRQMSWIRIERYFDKLENGDMHTSLGPTACQQCDNAGCEPVCPVYATYHNPDGLNAQVYNRCVGTRYCANNCIYKQRRFNWRTYSFPYPLNMQLNPEVTVRSKGVMEKCTFCMQRIRKAKATAKYENRLVKDGDFMTACQAVCPTKAITFGNGVDKNSQVSKLKKDPRGYHQLEEVNFKPAITYLKKVLADQQI